MVDMYNGFAKSTYKNTTMPKTLLTDALWVKLSQLMQHSGIIYNKPEHRRSNLFRKRTGCPWRDLPKEFGNWSAVFRRFNLWSRKGVLLHLFNRLSKDTDLNGCLLMEVLFVLINMARVLRQIMMKR